MYHHSCFQETTVKKKEKEEELETKKKKVALLLSYCGSKYHGMQKYDVWQLFFSLKNLYKNSRLNPNHTTQLCTIKNK